MFKNTILFKKENGVSLVELLVYAAILAVIIAAAYTIFDGSYRAYDQAEGQAKAQEEARIAHATMTKHVRMAEGLGLKEIPEEKWPYEIIIYTDINDDDELDEIQYYLKGDKLYRTIKLYGAETEEKFLVGDVRNTSDKPIFNYIHDDNGRIKEVEITLIIDRDPTRPPAAYTLKSNVTLRNYSGS
ncbi:MAG: prepilin-type N-terminal cleavage/methylation domain-containing protein [Actinobacteria bacterium]|nr:prepilin-type N-terminal cleavage/methylation domain-containing protein [Actinomycetota bacterium]